MTPLLEARNVSLRYGSVNALDRVSIALAAGTVTALLGDNGAGKSTLIRILSGVLQPTEGSLAIDGRIRRLASPRDARRHGIATVFQDLALAPLLSVWRNFVLGDEPQIGRGPWRRLDRAQARADAVRLLAQFGLNVDPDRPAVRLSGGERQILAIARAVHTGARVLILDEPTAALAVGQADRVLEAVRTARTAGKAVLLVTHNPAHALAVADRVTVLSLGRVLSDINAAETNIAQLTEMVSPPVTPSARPV